jgi:hypothetical protein
MPLLELTYAEGALQPDARAALVEQLTAALMRWEGAPDNRLLPPSDLGAHPRTTRMGDQPRRRPADPPVFVLSVTVPAGVEIWHADAAGLYSGFGSSPSQGTVNTKRYLRGHQKSDASGELSFLTIYPGWYRGRMPHIHVKVHVGGNTVHTGQLFFRDRISDRVYATSHYRSHGEPDTTNSADSIYKQAGESAALVSLKRRSATSLAKGFNGSAVLAVKA